MVALSTCEAEFLAFFEMCLECVWLAPVLRTIGVLPAGQPLIVYQDNQATVIVSTREAISRRTKHYGMRHHWVVEQTLSGVIRPVWCSTVEMLADCLTKALARVAFTAGRLGLGVVAAPQWVLSKRSSSHVSTEAKLYVRDTSGYRLKTSTGPSQAGDEAGDGPRSPPFRCRLVEPGIAFCPSRPSSLFLPRSPFTVTVDNEYYSGSRVPRLRQPSKRAKRERESARERRRKKRKHHKGADDPRRSSRASRPPDRYDPAQAEAAAKADQAILRSQRRAREIRAKNTILC